MPANAQNYRDNTPVDGDSNRWSSVRFSERFGTPEPDTTFGTDDTPDTPTTPPTPDVRLAGPPILATGTPTPAPGHQARARQAARQAMLVASLAGLRLHGPSRPQTGDAFLQPRRVHTAPVQRNVNLVTAATRGPVALTTSRNANLARRAVSAPIRVFADLDDDEEDDGQRKRRLRRRRRGIKPSGGPGFTIFRDHDDDDDNKENIPPPMEPMLGRIR